MMRRIIVVILLAVLGIVAGYGLRAQTASTAQGLTGTVTIGGGALLGGACTSATATITGATTNMIVSANPTSDPLPALTTGIATHYWVSSANTVTIRECAIVAVTPNSVTWNILVTPLK
jgi:hypothetical protein